MKFKAHDVNTHQEVEFDTAEQAREFITNVSNPLDWKEGPLPTADTQAGSAEQLDASNSALTGAAGLAQSDNAAFNIELQAQTTAAADVTATTDTAAPTATGGGEQSTNTTTEQTGA